MPSKGSRPELTIMSLSPHIVDPGTALTEINNFMQVKCRQYPAIVVALTKNAGFHIFDTITCFKECESSDGTFTGQQMKQREGYPDRDAPFPFTGVLLRGDAPKPPSGPTVRQRWEYFDCDEVAQMLPFSLRPLIPSVWLPTLPKKKR